MLSKLTIMANSKRGLYVIRSCSMPVQTDTRMHREYTGTSPKINGVKLGLSTLVIRTTETCAKVADLAPIRGAVSSPDIAVASRDGDMKSENVQ